MIKFTPKLKIFARKLRSHMTDAEIKLWQELRKKQVAGIKFLRQRPIGNYIVDFYAPEAGLVIEVDGGQHSEEAGEIYDRKRDAFLAGQRLKVIHFSNLDVLQNMEGVIERITETIKYKHPSPRQSKIVEGLPSRGDNPP